MNNMVIVFDIDGVLCWYPTFASRCTFKEDVVATLHPECPIIEFKDKYFCHTHVFIPYLDVLMQYLIDNGSRIAFFSAGTTMRNKTVIKRLLVEQIFSTVRWRESIINMSKENVSNFVEIGPGKVLSGMIKRTLKNINCFSINSIDDMKKTIDEFKK